MGFFKDLKNRARGMQNQMQGPILPQMPPPFMRRRQAPGTVLDLETGLPPVRPPLSNLKNIGNSVRRLPQIIPERMPSQGPTPRFFGGGLKSIFSRLMRNNPKFRGIQRMPMPPAIPNNMMAEPSLPMNFMPENMPRERFPMMRPGFAAGEDVDMNMIIAEQAAREGISPPEMAAQRIKEFLGETGRTVSNRDIELYGMGVLTLEDIMQRAEPITNRNLEQQEQMFFPESRPTDQRLNRMISAGRGTASSLDDLLADLEKKN